MTISDMAAAPAAGCVDPQALPWVEVELPTGVVGAKVLRISEQTSSFTVVSRMPAGVEVPRHRHLGEVHAYTHCGRWRYLEYEWIAGPGSYVYEPPGSVHTLHVLEDMETTFVISGGQEMLGPNDDVLTVENAATARALYFGMLEAQGLRVPAEILQ